MIAFAAHNHPKNRPKCTEMQPPHPLRCGQCAELCGKEHGFMPIVVEVVEPEKYAQWVAGRKKQSPQYAQN